ncbi:vitamin K-dependent protein C-like [Tetranychus urticae]|uniref:vitamin K-dependent protein C-like n=1 Tax=Tetranychus urticae TaxID=32264 RepID=UPI000D658C60|nr:vitamin K-dependent protein C-like [Tetranychus urticae]
MGKVEETSLSHEIKQSNIYCGRDTIPGQVPFYASIEYDEPNVHYELCSGVLIADRWILTEAYCLKFIFGPIRVVLGNESNNKTIGVEDYYIHPNVSLETTMNNIALLLLKEPVQFSMNIQPICLPEPGEDETFHGRYGTVAGREKLNPTVRKLPSNMHITTLPIDRSEDCDKFFKKVIKKNITDSFFCAGYPKRRKDACFPDRGDPFNFV